MDISDEIFRSSLRESGETIDLSMLQDWQIESIKSGMMDDLTLVSAPTGSGKTLVAQLLPLVYSKIHNHCSCFVFVVSPLVALVDDQIARLGASS